MFYSQFGEDRILSTYFRRKPFGVCIEVGANDGITDSNTFHFEQVGWECVLVEPNPELCKVIRTSRHARLFECAASFERNEATLYIADGANRSHGVSSLGSRGDATERIEGYGFVARPVRVATRTLDDILEEIGLVDSLDFVSIDVEGHELDVLRGFSMERWKPTVVIAEDNARFADASVRQFLAVRGYVPIRRTGVNDWYTHRSNLRISDIASRCGWYWAAFTTLARTRLRSVPGLMAIRNFLRGQST